MVEKNESPRYRIRNCLLNFRSRLDSFVTMKRDNSFVDSFTSDGNKKQQIIRRDIRRPTTDQTDVSMSIAGRVSVIEAKDTNLVFSPLSIHVVLNFIASGSSGSTRDQVLSFLKSNSSDDLNRLYSELISSVLADGSPTGGPKLSFANGLWIDKTLPLKPRFKMVVDDVYKAASKNVDFTNKAFEVISEVNSWAEKKTSGLIKDLLPHGSVNSTTKLIFANALYFKGTWKHKFNSSKTKEAKFHLLDGSSVKVPFMSSDENEQLIRAFDGFKILILPYEQRADYRRFSMIIILPDAKDGLPALIKKVTCQSRFLDRHVPRKRVEVDAFWVPKFKFSFGFEASKVLKELGVELPFSEQAEFTEMVDSPVARDLCVSSISQKSFIEVNEEGTRAAAATAVVFQYLCDIYVPR